MTRGSRASTGTGPSTADLLAELRPLLADLRVDLIERSKEPGVRAGLARAHEREQAAQRTADSLDAWCEGRAIQVAAAWVLSIIFVRTLEDRGLIQRRRIAGPGADDSQEMLAGIAPFLSARDYLLVVFKEMSRLPGVSAVFDARHNPVWVLGPSGVVADRLLEFFRGKDEAGELRWSFGGSDTRFLGDLYQDLDDEVRKRFALLQTPDFVESFILDETLTPAIRTFGLDKVKLIDPTCGSGHFLLGAFGRLFAAWQEKDPAEDQQVLAQRALAQVFGADLNPYAVGIARFRLTLAFLEAAGIERVDRAPGVRVNVCVADSLLHGVSEGQTLFSDRPEAGGREVWGDQLFALEDEGEAVRILGQRYHAVVGNPPYITCKDRVLREQYRSLYPDSAAGKFALAAPFAERFFRLAVDGGFVGMINANSFMKREFGKKLIEVFLRGIEITHVVDTSGAFIPGHGTPTVLVFGRQQKASGGAVLTVMGKRGEPSTPEDPAEGNVWSSIRDHHRELGFENDYLSVAEVERATFDKHPWSLGGGGAAELKELLEERAERRLGDLVQSIGISSFTLEDDVYLGPHEAFERQRVEAEFIRPMVIGEAIRDWSIGDVPHAVFPYDGDLNPITAADQRALVFLWPYRTSLANNMLFGGKTKVEGGLQWFEYGRLTTEKLRTPLSIAFAFVATHNHFVLDRGGKVFNRSAPIIKLPPDATEEDHLALLGYLNSSTACFWMKQAMMNKGGSGIGRGIQDEAWEARYEFDGTKMQAIPLPAQFLPRTDGWRVPRVIEAFAEQRQALDPAERIACYRPGCSVSLSQELHGCRMLEQACLARMVGLQEELDWMVYEAMGLLTDADRQLLNRARGEAMPNFPRQISRSTADVPRVGLHPGHRPFEVLLAERVIASGGHTAWFARNGYQTPGNIDDLYGPACVRLIRARVTVAERNKQVGLIEQPEYKRRWVVWDYASKTREAAAAELLGTVEEALSTTGPALTVGGVTATVQSLMSRPKFAEVAEVYAGDDSKDIRQVLAELVLEAAAPSQSALRYTDSGLAKRSAWEATWDLQRREDAGEQVDIPVPPKYKPTDFRSSTYWRHRGKLDVPKERFISYPGAESDNDPSPLIGWAGWDHLQQATALSTLYQQRKDDDGWGIDRLTPLLAGLWELVPWLKQWHNEPSDEFGGLRLGDFYETFVKDEVRAFKITVDELRAWRPTKKTRGRTRITETGRAAGPGRSRLSPEALLAAVRQLQDGTGADGQGVLQKDLADHLGLGSAKVGKVAAALVADGRLIEVSRRPKKYAVSRDTLGKSDSPDRGSHAPGVA